MCCGLLSISGIPHCSFLNVHVAYSAYIPGYWHQHQAPSLYQLGWQLHSWHVPKRTRKNCVCWSKTFSIQFEIFHAFFFYF